MSPDNIALGNKLIEPLFDCPYSGISADSLDAQATASGNVNDGEVVIYDKLPPPLHFLPSKDPSILTGTCNEKWL